MFRVYFVVVSVRGSTINNEWKRTKKELNTTRVSKQKRKQRHLQQRKEDVKREEEEDEEEGAASARARQMQCRRRGKTAFGFLHSLALFPSRALASVRPSVFLFLVRSSARASAKSLKRAFCFLSVSLCLALSSFF